MDKADILKPKGGVMWEPGLGLDFIPVVARAKELAARSGEPVLFRFNDVLVVVMADTDAELLHRDYLAGGAGLRSIGPWPQATDLRQENERLQKALQFYADPVNYSEGSAGWPIPGGWEHDCLSTAREALGLPELTSEEIDSLDEDWHDRYEAVETIEDDDDE